MNQKKIIRRKNALTRFAILSAEQYKAQGKDNYPAYIERKQEELKALNK